MKIMRKLRILLAEDHLVMREGLKRLINDQPDMEVVGEADDGIEAWHKARELQPDVVLMDVSMPGLNGAEATQKIKEEFPEIKVLALTAQRATAYLDQMLTMGASGYVLKQVAFHELIKAIHTVAEGGKYVDEASRQHIINSYVEQRSLKGETQGRALSEREEEVLRLVVHGYTNKEIAAKLDIGVKTVETHKANLMKKLNLKSRAEIVDYAISRGWL
jgi:two-component system response regulator NreC